MRGKARKNQTEEEIEENEKLRRENERNRAKNENNSEKRRRIGKETCKIERLQMWLLSLSITKLQDLHKKSKSIKKERLKRDCQSLSFLLIKLF